MLDTTQLLLSIMIFLLGITLTLIGIQVFFILREVRKNMEKINLILEEVHQVASNFTTGSGQISQVIASLRESFSTFSNRASMPFAGTLTLIALVKKLLDWFRKPEEKGTKE